MKLGKEISVLETKQQQLEIAIIQLIRENKGLVGFQLLTKTEGCRKPETNAMLYNGGNTFNSSVLVSIVEPETQEDFDECFKALERAKQLIKKREQLLLYEMQHPDFFTALQAKIQQA